MYKLYRIMKADLFKQIKERVWAAQIARALPLKLADYSLLAIEDEIAVSNMLYREHYEVMFHVKHSDRRI